MCIHHIKLFISNQVANQFCKITNSIACVYQQCCRLSLDQIDPKITASVGTFLEDTIYMLRELKYLMKRINVTI